MSTLPLISCVTPTRRRRRFVRCAIANFMEQTYPNKELIILGDEGDRLDDLIPEGAPIRISYGPRRGIGEKLNALNAIAKGDIIAHWDDDDWRHAEWLASQYTLMHAVNGLVIGMPETIYYHPESKRAWIYRWTEPTKKWVAGGTMMYHKSVWKTIPFSTNPLVGPDTTFIFDKRQKRVVYNPNTEYYVARIHGNNTNPILGDLDKIKWPVHDAARVQEILNGAWDNT